ncbi:MAG TPA: 2-succinyl-5-enolpyruvyl-6-hydroxy-3-cyclohexene-1-carboxylic-acid synthase [Usitatibacteraceae bacterium]|nr:2-succinyl-5-enolpyruvyl-6-hydroxy-3-cyclohexene-1-carboxylic-acid synthase [Usitatibacteraceae bacterium]
MTLAGGDAAPRAGGGLGGPAATARANFLWGRALAEGLAAGGVRHVCLSPGSRSSPLAIAAHRDSRLSTSMQIDERSSAFLALGIAKATGAPVALVCTSGTAAANFLPAVVEASLAGVPLVVLTADRPPELRGVGASQTIDQIALYGSHVRLFRDLPCADGAGSTASVAASAARDACHASMAGRAGPVHLNVPFREPLVPAPEDLAACEAAWDAVEASLRQALSAMADPGPRMAPGLPVLASLAARLEKARRPLLVAGPGSVGVAEAAAVLALARAAGMPVFADIASGLRGATLPGDVTACFHADLFLRDEAIADLAPDFVLRLGGIPTSKTLATWLARHRPPLVAIQPDESRRDPDGIVTEAIVSRAGALCEALALHVKRAARDDAWEATLRSGEAGARALLDAMPREAAAVAVACRALPPGGALFLSSSMPIRWAEMYAGALPEGVAVHANRGANGIDGVVSTAIGVAAGSGAPTLLVTGDLAFLHDAGGLRAARQLRTPLAILLLENDGGGIFSHLPVARHEEVFEPLFGTPHGCELAAVSRAAGIDHAVAATLDEVASLAAQTFAGGGVRVIEWRTDRAETLREQAALTRLPGVHADRVESDGLAWQVRSRGPRGGVPLVLLHGFTGTGEFWLPVATAIARRRCLFPDLPGHGGTGAPVPAPSWRLERAADALVSLLGGLGVDRFALAGYSLGGRLALSLALRHPDRVAALALVGASPGIANEGERATRARADLDLAATLERDGIEAFCRQWEANPLFATQVAMAPALREAMRSQRLGQDPARLAAALRAFGTGFQPPVHDALAGLSMPVLVMAGERDEKFSGIARDMAGRIPGAVVRLVAGAGHAVPIERAAACAAALEEFLKGSIDR